MEEQVEEEWRRSGGVVEGVVEVVVEWSTSGRRVVEGVVERVDEWSTHGQVDQ